MDRYNDFSVEDFVWDDFFRQWTLSPTPETEELWNAWIESNPAMLEKVAQAKALVLSLRLHEPDIDDAEIHDIVKRTVGRIASADTSNAKPGHVHQFFNTWTRIAASIALITVLGWAAYLFLGKKDQKLERAQIGDPISDNRQLVENVNNTKGTMAITLSDGSHISLAPKGRLRYAERFDGERREVYLEGDAFFDIAKDPNHPFLVYANGLITKVLGTSFLIESQETTGEVTVEVKTGKVSVFTQSDPKVKEKLADNGLRGLVLKPNQKVIFARNEVKMIKTLVEKPVMVVAKADIPPFDFEDTPASEVFNTIAKAYGIDIIYDAALLKDCPLTALLEGLTLHDKLNIICKAVESSYEIVDGQVIIHSKGCKN